MDRKLNRFGAVVIYPDERIKGYGNILAIARRDAQVREGTKRNIDIKSVLFDPVCNVWVALYPSHKANEKRYTNPLLQAGEDEK